MTVITRTIYLLSLMAITALNLNAAELNCGEHQIAKYWDIESKEKIKDERHIVYFGANGIPFYQKAIDKYQQIDTINFNDRDDSTTDPIYAQVQGIDIEVTDYGLGAKPENRYWLNIKLNDKNGWIQANDTGVVCSNLPLYGDNHIQRKMVVKIAPKSLVNPQSQNKGEGQNKREMVYPFDSPAGENSQPFTNKGITAFKLFYIYQQVGDWLLVSPNGMLTPRTQRLWGWVNQSQVIEWHTRRVAQPIADLYFYRDNDGIRANEEHGKFIKDKDKDFASGDPRPLILDEDEYFYKVVYPITVADAEKARKLATETNQLRQEWDKLNIIFLVDITQSNRLYIKAISQVLNDTLANMPKSKDKIQFAVARYTDNAYLGQHRFKIEQLPTSNTTAVSNSFEELERLFDEISNQRSGGSDPTQLEDLYGAIQKLQNANIIDGEHITNVIVLTDMGGTNFDDYKAQLDQSLQQNLVLTMMHFGTDTITKPNGLDESLCPKILTQRLEINNPLLVYCSHKALPQQFRQLIETNRDIKKQVIFQNSYIAVNNPTNAVKQLSQILNRQLTHMDGTDKAIQEFAAGGRLNLGEGGIIQFTSLLRTQLLNRGFTQQELDEGIQYSSDIGWMAKDKTVEMLLITASELSNWQTVLGKFKEFENGTVVNVTDAIADSVAIYAKEQHLDDLTINEIWQKMTGAVPKSNWFRSNGIKSLKELDKLRDDIQPYADSLAAYSEIFLELMSNGICIPYEEKLAGEEISRIVLGCKSRDKIYEGDGTLACELAPKYQNASAHDWFYFNADNDEKEAYIPACLFP